MTTYSDYNPAGTVRTSFRAKAKHIPLLPDHFNHLWFDDYITDFLEKNFAENNGIISGCVISPGAADEINVSGGEALINGVRTAVPAPGIYTAVDGDGWYTVHVSSAGSVIFGYIQNSTAQSASAPNDAVLIGYAVRGNGNFFVYSFRNLAKDVPEAINWGTSAQVSSGAAEFYTDAAGAPLDKDAAAYAIPEDSKVEVVYDSTLAGNLKIEPPSSVRMFVSMAQGVELDFGDAGSGEPYKLIIGGNVKSGSEFKIRGTQEFIDLPFALTDDQKRFIANQAEGVRVQYNKDVIYDPANVGNIVTKDSWPANPYLIRMNGQQLNYRVHQTIPATNNTLAWQRDLNKYLNGYRDGSEVASRFTLPAIIAANPHLFQVNTPNGMLRDISTVDPDIHARTDSNGVSIAATVDFVNSSSTVTIQTTVGNIKNFMRLNGASAQGIPDGVSGTTILVDIDETAKTATMVDALTFIPVAATSTVNGIAATIDNSGAAGGSLQIDAFQGHLHGITTSENPPSFGNDAVAQGEFGVAISLRTDTQWDTHSSYGTPRPASVTRDNSTDVYIFYQG